MSLACVAGAGGSWSPPPATRTILPPSAAAEAVNSRTVVRAAPQSVVRIGCLPSLPGGGQVVAQGTEVGDERLRADDPLRRVVAVGAQPAGLDPPAALVQGRQHRFDARLQ